MEKRSDTEGIQMNWKSRRRGGGLEYFSRFSRNCRFPLPILLHLSLSLCLPLFPALSRVGKKENPAIINRTLFHDTRGEPREEGTRRRLIDRDPLLSD